MANFMARLDRLLELQWVHGPITVVMVQSAAAAVIDRLASMGPRSDNRGYEPNDAGGNGNGGASMGPRSDNRGYGHWLKGLFVGYLRFNGSTVR